MATGELTDEEVFGRQELSDEEVFAIPKLGPTSRMGPAESILGRPALDAVGAGLARGLGAPPQSPDEAALRANLNQRYPWLTLASEAVPGVLMPQVRGASIPARMGLDAVTGAAQGAAQARADESDTLTGAIQGAVTGGLVSGGLNTLGKGVRFGIDRGKVLFGTPTAQTATTYIGKEITPEMQKRLADARSMGIDITPAEASGDAITAARQGTLGVSESGAEALQAAGKARAGQRTAAVGTLLSDISPRTDAASGQVRQVAKAVIEEQRAALEAKAKPLYDKVQKFRVTKDLAEKLTKDPLILETLRKVSSEPGYARQFDKLAQSSYARWDIVKQALYDDAVALRSKGNKNLAASYDDARKFLTRELDKASPRDATGKSIYAQARAAYGPDAESLRLLRESPLGRIADLADKDLKQASRILFDASETDPKYIAGIRQQFLKQDPNAWRQMLRNEMERRLDAKSGGQLADNFYKSILGKPKDFKLFYEAAQGLPDVQRRMLAMKSLFPDLINQKTVRGAEALAKSSLDVPRSSLQAAIDTAQKLAGGKMDKAAVDLILNPQWDDEFRRLTKIKGSNERGKALVSVLARVSASLPSEQDSR